MSTALPDNAALGPQVNTERSGDLYLTGESVTTLDRVATSEVLP